MVLSGDKELQRRFRNAPPKLQNGIGRKAAREAARPVLKTAQQLVPVDERELWKVLKIRALPRSRKNRGVVGVRVTTDKKMLEQIHQDRTTKVFNPHWAEYGVPEHMNWGKEINPLPEQPFMRPAADNNKVTVRNIFEKIIRQLVGQL